MTDVRTGATTGTRGACDVLPILNEIARSIAATRACLPRCKRFHTRTYVPSERAHTVRTYVRLLESPPDPTAPPSRRISEGLCASRRRLRRTARAESNVPRRSRRHAACAFAPTPSRGPSRGGCGVTWPPPPPANRDRPCAPAAGRRCAGAHATVHDPNFLVASPTTRPVTASLNTDAQHALARCFHTRDL